MAGGRLKIDFLVGGSVVHPFQVLDGVHGGQIDGAHTVTVYWYGKHKAASLFGTGPVFGFNANEGLGWIHNGGGRELFDELQTQIMKVNVISFFAMPMPTQPLGWFKKPVKSMADMRGLKYRTVGLAADLMQAMGLAVAQLPGGEIVPAMERGVIDAFEFNNPTSDRRFGAQDVAKNYMMGSHHQATEYFEIMFNRTKFNALPKEQQAILQYAAEAVSSANEWKAYDYYSKDLQELQEKDKVNVLRTPKDVFDAQIKAWDGLIAQLDKDPVHEEGDGFAEGVGEAGGVLRSVQRHRLPRRLRASLRQAGSRLSQREAAGVIPGGRRERRRPPLSWGLGMPQRPPIHRP